MQISTVGDAQTALIQLLGDLAKTQQDIINANSTAGATFFPSIGASIDKFFGGTGDGDVYASSTSLIKQLTDTATRIANELSGSAPDAALSPQEIAELAELQKEVISARLTIGRDISEVDWSFGGIFKDTVNILENWGTDAATNLPHVFGINWTMIIVALVIVGAGYLFIWKEIG